MLAVFAIPFINYAIGVNFADERIWQIAITLVVLVPVELIWTLLVKAISWLFDGIFNFLIDVVPDDGRTAEEAQLVVKGGDEAVAVWQIDNTEPEDWSEEIIQRGLRGDFISRLYTGRRIERMEALKRHYIENPDLPRTEYTAEEFFKTNSMYPSFFEQVISNKVYRWMALPYLFLLWLLITHLRLSGAIISSQERLAVQPLNSLSFLRRQDFLDAHFVD